MGPASMFSESSTRKKNNNIYKSNITSSSSPTSPTSTSIHFSTGGWGPITRPAIPGHEIVGTVVARGKKAVHQIGDRVGVGCLVSCCREPDLCDWCKKGEDQFCSKRVMTFNAPYKDGRGGISEGGFADRIRVYGDYAFKSKPFFLSCSSS